MTRRVSKHGTTYTEGSSSTAPSEYPRVCALCGERILVSKTGFEQRADHTVRGLVFRSRHLNCPPFRVAVRRPRPDFDPRIDYPERYTEGPV